MGLHYAAYNGNKELARVLVQDGPARLVLPEAAGGETSLFVACARGHLEVAKILIEAGSETHLFKRQKEGSTCLHGACMRGHLELVKAQSRQAGSCTFSPPKTTEAQLRHLPPRGVHALTARGSEALNEAGRKALVFAPENNGGFCLHMECSRGHLKVAKILIKAGGEALILATDWAFGFSCLPSLVCLLLTLP